MTTKALTSKSTTPSWLLSLEWVQQHEALIATNVYSVSYWINYIDDLDEHMADIRRSQEASSQKSARATDTDGSTSRVAPHGSHISLQQWWDARDWVGRRAVSHLPRSYKLWKLVWDFLLAATTVPGVAPVPAPTVQSCFERAVRTLSLYPRVWIVYVQWMLSLLQNTEDDDTVISVTYVRRTWNRALWSIPVAQHGKLWEGTGMIEVLMSMEFQENNCIVPWETAHCLVKRYAVWRHCHERGGGGGAGGPTAWWFGMDYAAWCQRHEKWGLAAVAYQDVLNNLVLTDASHDPTTRTVQHEAWYAFTQLVAHHADAVQDAGVAWELILQTAIQQQLEAPVPVPSSTQNDASVVQVVDPSGSTMLGLLYAWLASAWIQQGSIDMAVAVYEQGLLQVRTVRDFAVLYAAYLSLTEGIMTALSDSILEDDDVETDDAANDADQEDDWDLLIPNQGTQSKLGASTSTTGHQLAEMELAMARAEHLTARRPLLLNAVKLRQDPHDCASWIERADLYVALDQPRQAVAALLDGLEQIHPKPSKQTTTASSLSQVVLRLVQVHTESLNDVPAARDVLDRVCRQRTLATGFVQAHDLAECWAAWIELELQQESWDEALSLARQSVAGEPRQQRANASAATPYRRLNLTRLLRLWDLLLDLEESLGTVQTTKDAYNRALEIKVATVQHVLNFGTFLTEQTFFEESFTAYERGIELFAFPHAGAKLLWKAYLTAFLERYSGTKVERARNLFQRCLDDCPPEECAEFFMMSGEFEEQYGLTKRALSVYRAMCDRVTAAEKYTAYQLFVVKTTQYLGVTATRDIYQDALEKLTEPVSFVNMCTEFAQMEVGLHELERARVIFAYGAQSADPRRIPEFWRDWNDFEVAHGNEDSFREMLRVKRSVEAAFSTVNYNASGMTEQVQTLSNDEAMRMIANGEGMDDFNGATETQSATTTGSGFVAASRKRTVAAASLDEVEEKVAKLRQATGVLQQQTSAPAVAPTRADDDDNEIDLDDLDAEIEAAANEGAAATTSARMQDVVATRAIPEAVFGGLTASAAAQKAA